VVQGFAEAEDDQRKDHNHHIFEFHSTQYIVAITFGSRTFAPRPFTTLVTIALLVLLISLGRWQLRRADQQQHSLDAFAAGTDGSLTLDGGTPALPRYQHVQASGHYDAARQVLIDNMVTSDGRVGYFVITPFALTGGGWLLVNRGWVPQGASRADRPDIAVADSLHTVHGRVDHLPSPGIHMGHPAPLAAPFPVVAAFPSLPEIRSLLGAPTMAPAAEVLLLDPSDPDGYRRVWTPPGFPPMRHLGYAVQWFGLAAALAVIYLVTNTRRA
jgi:surfeit locus 1 family protein